MIQPKNYSGSSQMIQKDLHIKQKICKFAPTDEIREISSIDQQLESKRKESIHAGE
jgi:hypothetical protein